MLVAGTVQEAIELNVSVTDIAKLSGYTLLVAGATGYYHLHSKLIADRLFLPSHVNMASIRCLYFRH